MKIKICGDDETGTFFEGYGWEVELPDTLVDEWRTLTKRLTQINHILDEAMIAAMRKLRSND